MSEQPKKEESPLEEEGLIRYAGYAGRLRTILLSAKRYLAYTSDVGEAVRPIVPPSIVRLAYGVSWAYVAYDVATETRKSQLRGDSKEQTVETAVKRAVFQSVASMALPSLAIHTQVRIFKSVFQKMGRFQRWGPTAAGFALIPALPYMFDEPVEHALEKIADIVHEMLNKKSS